MSTNPYESPGIQAAIRSTSNEDRLTALRSLRIALPILVVPAIYNLICFSFPFDANRIDVPIHNVYRTINLIGLVLIVSAIWFFGLLFLESVTGGLHSFLARKSQLEDWKTALYAIVRRFPLFAVPGAALWAIWVAAFYQLHLDFFTVSVPIGVAAHLLAAALYVPLFYRWYKMERHAGG